MPLETPEPHAAKRSSENTKKEYRELLRSLRESESTQQVANLRPWHCALAVSELLRLAQSLQGFATPGSDPVQIRVMTGSCPQHVYGKDTLPLFESFLQAGGIVNVLVYNEEPMLEQNSLFNLSKKTDRVRWRCSRTRANGDNLSHFLVVGARAYRLEAPHKYYPPSVFSDLTPEIPAKICFNDEHTAKALVAFFDTLWPHCYSVS